MLLLPPRVSTLVHDGGMVTMTMTTVTTRVAALVVRRIPRRARRRRIAVLVVAVGVRHWDCAVAAIWGRRRLGWRLNYLVPRKVVILSLLLRLQSLINV
jgi:hypothetical protein